MKCAVCNVCTPDPKRPGMCIYSGPHAGYKQALPSDGANNHLLYWVDPRWVKK